MPLTLVKENGTGLSNANSYANVADCDAYHEGHLWASTWTSAITATKEAALVLATRLIDANVQFNGLRTTSGQALLHLQTHQDLKRRLRAHLHLSGQLEIHRRGRAREHRRQQSRHPGALVRWDG